jgi:RecB family exonuclease
MKNLLTKSQIANFPVPHLSMSAIRNYLTDRQSFFRRYVRWEFDEKASPALVEGKAIHFILEEFWKAKKEGKDFDWEKKIEEGIQTINEQDIDGKIEWGKTGSFEKSAKVVYQAAHFYKDALPDYKEIVNVEKKFVTDFEDLDNNPMPVALKGFCDLIVKDKKDYLIVDHKLVTSVKNQDEIVPAFELQAAAYFFLTRKEYGVNPKAMIFDQIKKSKSRNGDPQVVPYKVEFTPQILLRFLEIYQRILRELSGQPLIDEQTGIVQFLPNPFASFGWEESWEDFCEEIENEKKWTLDEIKEIRKNRYSDEGVEALDI